MNDKLLRFGIVLLLGIFIGLSFGYLNAFIGFFEFAPSNSQSEFVETCGELNNQDLTAENIKKPRGWCHLGRIFTECGEEKIKRLKDSTDPFFNIYHKKQADNTWVCAIEEVGADKIKARLYYQYE